MTYVPSELNPADKFSRQLSGSDAMLSRRCWDVVDTTFGGLQGHMLDLMALDSNVQCDHVSLQIPRV